MTRALLLLLALGLVGCGERVEASGPRAFQVKSGSCWYVCMERSHAYGVAVALVHAGDCPSPAHRDTTGGRK